MDITIVAAAIIAYLQHIADDARLSSSRREEARVALSEAYHSTVEYYASLSSGAAQDQASQIRIAGLWDRAAILVEPHDRNLAARLGLKSRYWREGAAWTDEQIAGAKIGLDAVRRDGNFRLIRRNVS